MIEKEANKSFWKVRVQEDDIYSPQALQTSFPCESRLNSGDDDVLQISHFWDAEGFATAELGESLDAPDSDFSR